VRTRAEKQEMARGGLSWVDRVAGRFVASSIQAINTLLMHNRCVQKGVLGVALVSVSDLRKNLPAFSSGFRPVRSRR
jgi:hypothetical protein